ncbi:DUF6928 family protein [Rhodococcus spongiicola]|uniref:Uncharacterized protein n=1 Tax=Rhodococcus spongiicola TaxID=2487352 RepID=A0A3S3E6F1_9NOCA|nr:hypothetical protein [Rhodococcus spongiicola]RVW06415.1 hypothetical protein EF834_03035 [Rhodococcus spongiicola]
MSGVNASTLWYVDVDDPIAALRDATPDRDAAQALAVQLHPGLEVTRLGDESLSEATELEEGEIVVGCFAGVSIVRTGESLPPAPSSLVEHWIDPTGSRHTYLYSSSSVTGVGSWGAFAHWDGAELKRSFSATPIHIIEDLGLPQVWERPFWAGEHPMQPSVDVLPDPQTLPFDPAEFAEAASRAWLGEELNPASISVSRFAIYPAGDIPVSVQRLTGREQTRPKRRSLLARLFRDGH